MIISPETGRIQARSCDRKEDNRREFQTAIRDGRHAVTATRALLVLLAP